LTLPLKSLEHDIERVDNQLEEQVNDSEAIVHVVRSLEDQYDAYMERYRTEHPQTVMPGEQNVPTGEEISAEIQRFLADLDPVSDFLDEDKDDHDDSNPEDDF